ncbi:MAG: DNA methyltransferase [Rhodanobacteraceae bacterium]
MDLIYLDPPFNSKRDYNLLFKTPKGLSRPAIGREPETGMSIFSDAQITAFEDSWHGGEQAEREFGEILRQSNTDVAELMPALRAFLGENDMMAYLVMMENRLMEMHRVLKPTGSLYLHCDPTASHYLKIALDGVFGKKNYVNEVIWKRTAAHSDAKQRSVHFGRTHDTIFFYAKSADDARWNPQWRGYDDSYLDSH